MSAMDKAEYMKRWRAEHAEEIRAKRKAYWHSIQKHRPRGYRGKSPEKRCICGVLLLSVWGTKTRRKYCDSCFDALGRKIYNLYQRRAYSKRVGKVPPPIIEKEIMRP